jgi:hypothetical protein
MILNLVVNVLTTPRSYSPMCLSFEHPSLVFALQEIDAAKLIFMTNTLAKGLQLV